MTKRLPIYHFQTQRADGLGLTNWSTTARSLEQAVERIRRWLGPTDLKLVLLSREDR